MQARNSVTPPSLNIYLTTAINCTPPSGARTCPALAGGAGRCQAARRQGSCPGLAAVAASPTVLTALAATYVSSQESRNSYREVFSALSQTLEMYN